MSFGLSLAPGRFIPNKSILFEYHAGDSIPSLGGTFARASSATYTDDVGLVQSAASNALRDSHYINGAQYALLEGQLTNLCPVNRLVDSDSVNLTTISNTAIAPDGSESASCLSHGAISSNYGIAYGLIDATNQTVTFSTYLKGDIGGEVVWVMSTPDGVNYNRTECVLTTEWQRFSVTVAVGGSSHYYQIGVDLRDSQQSARPAQTFYQWGAQLEEGPFASSYIPTAGSTVTRAADSLSFPFPHPPQEMSVYVRFIDTGGSQEPYSRVFQIGDGVNDVPRFVLDASGGTEYRVNYKTATEERVANVAHGIILGSQVEVVSTLESGSISLTLSVDSGAESSLSSFIDGIAGEWSEQRVWVGTYPGNSGFTAFRDIIIARGIRDLNWFRSRVSP